MKSGLSTILKMILNKKENRVCDLISQCQNIIRKSY